MKRIEIVVIVLSSLVGLLLGILLSVLANHH